MTQEPKKIKVQLLGEPKILAAEIMLQMAGEGHVTDQMKLSANDSKEIQVKSGETNIIFELSPPESQMIGGELHTQPKSTADHVIIVLDPTDKNAMDIAEAQIESAKKLFPTASIVLVATKSDEKENWQVTSGQLQTLAQKQKCRFQEASATTGIGCQEIVDVIAKQAATLKVDQNPVTESKILTTPTQGSQHPTPQNIQLSSSKNSDKKELKKKEKQIKKTNKTKTDEVISPKEFATSLRQFSLQYLPDITPAQLKMDPRKKGQRGALDSHIDAQEKLQQFIILDLLRQDNAQDMQRTFNFYLNVLEESIKNNDFQSAATLLGALKSPSILRLRKEEIRLTKVGDRPTVIDAGDNKCIKLNNAQIEFLRAGRW